MLSNETIEKGLEKIIKLMLDRKPTICLIDFFANNSISNDELVRIRTRLNPIGNFVIAGCNIYALRGYWIMFISTVDEMQKLINKAKEK